jgi:hypothetical protein
MQGNGDGPGSTGKGKKMFEQEQRFAFEKGARLFYNESGKALGYCEPFLGGDGWWKLTRYVKV